MPYKSKAQKRYFEGCKNNPETMKGECPPKAVLTEFHEASYRQETKRAHHAQKKRGDVRFH